MYPQPFRKVDQLVLVEFIPFFLMGVAAFTLLMVAVILFREMLTYVTNYGLSLADVGMFFVLALPQTIAYTFPMAILFAGLLSFGRMSDTSQITALRAGGISFFRIVLPALIFAWFVVLLTFLINEKVAPRSTLAAKLYIQHALMERGIALKETDISYMDTNAGWLFAAASGEGNLFHDVKWWDFSRPGEITLYTADEGVWQADRWEFHNAHVIHISLAENQDPESVAEGGEDELADLARRGNVIRSMTSETLEMQIARTPSDILAEAQRDPEEMSLQELGAFLSSPAALERSPQHARRILGTYHLKIAVPFASIMFILIAAPLGLTPHRSTGTLGIGVSIVLVFIYYLLTTFSVKIAEGGILAPMLAAWLPNILFLVAGGILIGRFHIRNA